MILTIDCSPDQLDIIEDHLLEGGEIGMPPDERHWMIAQARKQHPTCKILGADLDLENGKWILTITN
jgi:hypothetical protein